MAILGSIIGAGLQAGLGALNNVWAQQQQSEARAENYKYGEMAANNADARTRALYNDFYSPQALMRQYQQAGLSTSMMFGGTPGQGGTSGAQGTGAAGPSTPYMPISMLEGAQIANIAAQTENIKADTEGKKINNGTLNQLNLSTIAKNWAEAGHQEASAELQKSLKTWQDLQNEIGKATKEFNIDTVIALCEKAEHEAGQALWLMKDQELTYNYNLETYEKRVEFVQEQVNNLIKDSLLKDSQIKLNEKQIESLNQQIKESIAKIAQGWRSLNLEARGQTLNWRSTLRQQDINKNFIKEQVENWMRQNGLEKWKIGAETFNGILNAASRFLGLYMFSGSKETTNPFEQPVGTPSPMQSGSW